MKWSAISYNRIACLFSASLAVLFSFFPGPADGKSFYEVFLLEQKPRIDGSRGDEWGNVPFAGDFVRLGTSERAAKPTFFWIGYTIEGLYMGARCIEPDTDRIKAERGDGESLWGEDSVEIFFIPEGQDESFQFIVNAIGSKWSRGIELDAWEASVYQGEGYWSLEVRIPFELFGHLPEKNESWKFNITRNIHSLPDPQLTTWSPSLESNFQEPENFGALIFKEVTSRALSEVSALPEMSDFPEFRRPGVVSGDTFVYSNPGAGTFLQEGTEIDRIFFNQAQYTSPRICPDREKLLYHSLLGDGMGIWLSGLKGQNPSRLCDGEYAEWSPSGDKIVFQRRGRIIEREIDSGEEVVVSPENWSDCRYPSYLAERKIMFVAEKAERTAVYSVYLRQPGEPSLIFTLSDETSSTPKVCRDGEIIVYQDGAHIYLFNMKTRESRQLTMAGGVQSWPVWGRDGKGICYLQSMESVQPPYLSGPYDIYYTEIKMPHKTALVRRDVYPSFDWRGGSPAVADWIKLKDGELVVHEVEDVVEVSNNWYKVVLSKEDGKVVLQPEQAEERIELVFQSADGQFGSEVKDVVVFYDNQSSLVKLEVLMVSDAGKPMKAVMNISTNRPYLEIRPIENTTAITVKKKNLKRVILPDRFADDLVFSPGDVSSSRVILPRTTFALGLCGQDRKKGMFLIITPSEEQEIKLRRRRESDKFFEQTQITFSGESVFISTLYGEDLWFEHPTNTGVDAAGKRWRQPFQALWRFAAVENAGYSQMWYGEDIVGSDLLSLLQEKKNSGETFRGIVYLYGRSVHTPLSVSTPVDILYDTLGTEKTRSQLDIEGIKAYRVAEEWMPWEFYQDFFMEDTEAGEARIPGFSSRGVRITTQGGYDLVSNIHDDILKVLTELDNRIEEYRDFLSSLYDDSILSGLSLLEKFETVKKNIDSLPITDVKKIRLSEERIKKTGGRAPEYGSFRNFLTQSRRAADERRELLVKYREMVKKLRTLSGFKAAREPRNAGCYQLLRERTADVLRYRHYLEGDWRGEKPLRQEIH